MSNGSISSILIILGVLLLVGILNTSGTELPELPSSKLNKTLKLLNRLQIELSPEDEEFMPLTLQGRHRRDANVPLFLTKDQSTEILYSADLYEKLINLNKAKHHFFGKNKRLHKKTRTIEQSLHQSNLVRTSKEKNAKEFSNSEGSGDLLEIAAAKENEDIVSSGDYGLLGRNPFPETPPSPDIDYGCNHHRDCNRRLNERCIITPFGNHCACIKPLTRNIATQKCEETISLAGAIKCPHMKYELELADSNSDLYHTTEALANETIRLLLQQCDHINTHVINYHITGFSPGSVIVNWKMLFSGLNHSNIEGLVRNDLNKALVLSSETIGLNLKGASLLKVTTVNPCDFKELNHCSENADCLLTPHEKSFYQCKCKDGFTDVSLDSHDSPGEDCQILCPANYCHQKGTCEINNGMYFCKCFDFYYGTDCAISGLLIGGLISGALLFILLLLILLICVLYATRWRRSSIPESIVNVAVNTENRAGETICTQVAGGAAKDNSSIATCSKTEAFSSFKCLPGWRGKIKDVPKIDDLNGTRL